MHRSTCHSPSLTIRMRTGIWTFLPPPGSDSFFLVCNAIPCKRSPNMFFPFGTVFVHYLDKFILYIRLEIHNIKTFLDFTAFLKAEEGVGHRAGIWED